VKIALVALVAAALVLGGVGLYRYESTRTVTCSGTTIPLNSSDLNAAIRQAPYLNIVPGGVKGCHAKVDSANAEAQSVYIAYGVFVLLFAAGWLVVERRRATMPSSP
jgi:hypothetical protein